MANNNNNFSLIQSYPIFEPNQVLTDNQLNSAVSYLNSRNALPGFVPQASALSAGWANWESNGLRLTGGLGLPQKAI